MAKQRNRESKTSLRIINGKERRAKCLELRKQGYTYAEIAKKVGLKGRQQACNHITDAMKELVVEHVEDVRKLELERLDKIYKVVNGFVEDEELDVEDRCKAADRCLKVMERRAKIQGLDAPTKIAETDADGKDKEAFIPADEMLERFSYRFNRWHVAKIEKEQAELEALGIQENQPVVEGDSGDVGEIEIHSANGTNGHVNGHNGANGVNGHNGTNGVNGHAGPGE